MFIRVGWMFVGLLMDVYFDVSSQKKESSKRKLRDKGANLEIFDI